MGDKRIGFTSARVIEEFVERADLDEAQIGEFSVFMRGSVLGPLVKKLEQAANVRDRASFLNALLEIKSLVDDFRAMDIAATLAARNAAVRAKEKMRKQALLDDVTELFNKRGFVAQLENALRDRRVSHLAVLYMDLRGFKLWNDLFSHDAGNLVIQVFANILRKIRGAQVARMGGDEYAVLLRPCNFQTAFKVVTRLRELVDLTQWQAAVEELALRKGIINPLTLEASVMPVLVDIGVAVVSIPEGHHEGRSTVDPLVQMVLRIADQTMQDGKDLAHEQNEERSTFRIVQLVWQDGELHESAEPVSSQSIQKKTKS